MNLKKSLTSIRPNEREPNCMGHVLLLAVSCTESPGRVLLHRGTSFYNLKAVVLNHADRYAMD
jgi:hypothetical protein